MVPTENGNSPAQIFVSIGVLRQMFSYLSSLDIERDVFLRALDVDPVILSDLDAYIPIETYLKIQEGAAEFTQDPYFGLHMGEYLEVGSWSILGYLMMNCEMLVQAFEKSARYQRIIGNLIEGKAYLRFNKVKVTLSTPPHAPKMSRHCFESAIASTVRMMRTLTGKDISPLKVNFIYPKPESTAEYERILRCPIFFDQKENSFTLDVKVLFTPVLYPNPDLLEHFENYAQEFLVEMERQTEVATMVTEILLSSLDDEDLSIKKVAREMSMSVRTLQNRLKTEGVVFSDLLQEVREKLAKRYLRENVSVTDITYLLGFSEPSVFRKAFKRWAGVTPTQYRERPLSAGSQWQ